ncbi:hypothetical protein Syun_001019 [Stephania yunnanensis]|uniref:Uncharacterized protein n=1 Tax=Stephania yunnanensis TaxID=152371 RepID=A0AAP0Q7C1_9MAGN
MKAMSYDLISDGNITPKPFLSSGLYLQFTPPKLMLIITDQIEHIPKEFHQKF